MHAQNHLTAVGLDVYLCLGLGVDVTDVSCYSRSTLNIVQGKFANVRVHLQVKHSVTTCGV